MQQTVYQYKARLELSSAWMLPETAKGVDIQKSFEIGFRSSEVKNKCHIQEAPGQLQFAPKLRLP